MLFSRYLRLSELNVNISSCNLLTFPMDARYLNYGRKDFFFFFIANVNQIIFPFHISCETLRTETWTYNIRYLLKLKI